MLEIELKKFLADFSLYTVRVTSQKKNIIKIHNIGKFIDIASLVVKL